MKRMFWFYALVIFLFGACSSPWKVVKQADPNPLRKNYPYFVNPVLFSGLQVGDIPEAVYLRQLDPKSQEKWKLTKLSFSQEFQKYFSDNPGDFRFVGKPNPQTFVIIPEVVKIQKGDQELPTSVKLKVSFRRKSKVYDVIELAITVPASEGSFEQRLKVAAQKLAALTLNYLKSRAQ